MTLMLKYFCCWLLHSKDFFFLIYFVNLGICVTQLIVKLNFHTLKVTISCLKFLWTSLI